jgi:hypothetical protein
LLACKPQTTNQLQVTFNQHNDVLAAFKHLIPNFHAYSDDERRYNIGATWTAADGLQDYHNLEMRYVRNSEQLALQGQPQPDGSWKYVEPMGAYIP